MGSHDAGGVVGAATVGAFVLLCDMPKPHAEIDLAKLAPDVIDLVKRIAWALHKRSEGGAKITPKEWAAIGEAAGVVAVDVVADLTP